MAKERPETGSAQMPRAALRRKVARTARALEVVYGVPRWDGRESVLDSLVGCILSQNTNDLNSDRAWRKFKKRFPSWKSAAEAGASEIANAIRIGGLAEVKSRAIKRILDEVKRHTGRYSLEFVCRMDQDKAFAYLTAMNGVGWKTADPATSRSGAASGYSAGSGGRSAAVT